MNNTEIVQPNLFPFPFPIHLVFCCIALFFFAYLFSRDKKPYQLIMAIAIPFSLAIWISENRMLFYTIGIIELVLLIAAFVSSLVYNSKQRKASAVADTGVESAEEKLTENVASPKSEEISNSDTTDTQE